MEFKKRKKERKPTHEDESKKKMPEIFTWNHSKEPS
jgi:hypothetical protein